MPLGRTLAKILTLRCRDATELISASLDEGGLRRGDRLALRLHTLICGPCRRFRVQVERLRSWLRDHESIADATLETGPGTGIGAGLSDDARRRLEDLIRESS